MKANKAIAIITARMRSTRLKGKVLLPLYGKPALRWVADRCAQAKLVNGVIIATMADPSNDPIEKAMNDYLVFRYDDDEEDVLRRVLAAAKWIGADIIVDVSGDCPCVDPRHIDHLMTMLTDGDLDYVSNIGIRSFPDGLDCQCYKTEALVKVEMLFRPKTHVGWNISRHPKVFRIANWPAPPELHYPEWGLTLDSPEDYELLKIIFEHFGKNPAFAAEEVVAWLKGNPHLLEINKHIRRKDPATEG